METRSSRSKRKTGADTPSSQGEEEPNSESDFFAQLQLQQAEADRQLIAAFVGGTSATFSEQTMTTEHDMAFIEDLEPPGGSSSSATFSRRTRSHTKRESGSKSILNAVPYWWIIIIVIRTFEAPDKKSDST